MPKPKIGPDLLPAAKMRGLALVDEALGLGRQGEERLEGREVLGDERRIYSMIDEGEEPDLVAGRNDLLGEGLALSGIVTPAGKGDDWDVREGGI